MGRKGAAAGTPALALLSARGIDHRVHEYDHDPRASSFGAEAAAALGVPPERVLKTLVAVVDGTLAVGVIAVNDTLDLKALARALGGKRAVMAPVPDAERATGYVAGGISPLGQKRQLRTCVDTSALAWPTVYFSGGRRGLEIELAPADLVALSAAVTADLAASR